MAINDRFADALAGRPEVPAPPQCRDADRVETAAARRLDGILAERIPPDTLRLYWSRWMLQQLDRAIRTAPSEAVDWHLDLAESRLALPAGRPALPLDLLTANPACGTGPVFWCQPSG